MGNQGRQYAVEHRCYEARLFCESLLKGNHSIIGMPMLIMILTHLWFLSSISLEFYLEINYMCIYSYINIDIQESLFHIFAIQLTFVTVQNITISLKMLVENRDVSNILL